MTQRKLAERILEQAKHTDWCVCCLCSNFEICYKNEDINKNSHPKDCVELSDERAIVIRECDDKKSVLFGDKEVEE